MNICCLTRLTLAHEAKGGMEVHIKTLSEGLVRAGHKIKIITTAHPQGIEFESENGVEKYYCKGTKPSQYTDEWGEASLKLLSELHNLNPFDIVWGEGGGALYYIRRLRKVLKIPVVTILQGSFFADLRSQLSELRSNKNLILLFARQFPKRFYNYLTRDLYFAGRADAVIGSSKECAGDARLEYFLSKDRITASVNGVNVERFRPFESKPKDIMGRLGLSSDSLVVLTASRLIRGKGIHILIKAMSTVLKVMPNSVLLVAGIGPGEESLKMLAKDLEIDSKVIFLGYVPNKELVEYYNLCDVFVYPTLLYESFGISVAESMACGKTVIAAKSGGIATSIDHGLNGYLYKPHLQEQLEKLMIKILKDPQLRQRIGYASREKAVKYLSSDRMIKDAIGVFEKFDQKKNHSGSILKKAVDRAIRYQH
jgi:glycosyltransferase involved in cell wall biosynthesis